MNIEDSSVSYRAFLRSGSYPALSQRVMRSGSVLAQAAGWFALAVTAASGGYRLTQRLVTPSAASPSAHARVAMPAPSAQPSLASSSPNAHEVEPAPRESSALHAAKRTSTSAPAADKAAPRKRTGAVAQPIVAELAVDTSPNAREPARTEQIAERVPALDTAVQTAPAQARVERDPLDALMLASTERPRAATPPLREPVREVRPNVAPVQRERAARPAQPSQPLSASARVDNVSVRGPLSAAQLRRSVDRVRPTLSDCYADAARRAGANAFSQVRVVVTIDEAGRVKTLPKVEGAQLPGFAECLSTAMSKLVCQAPDTGTARASILLGFSAER